MVFIACLGLEFERFSQEHWLHPPGQRPRPPPPSARPALVALALGCRSFGMGAQASTPSSNSYNNSKERTSGTSIAECGAVLRKHTKEAAFFSAAESGNVSQLREALAAHPDLDIDRRGDKGRTPLLAAARHGHALSVKFLLSRGANPDGANDEDVTPMMVRPRMHSDYMVPAVVTGAVRQQCVDATTYSFFVGVGRLGARQMHRLFAGGRRFTDHS